MPTSTINAFWWRAENFGDCLTETLLNHYGLGVQHAHPYFAQLIGVGSILERVPQGFAGYVLGAGLLHEHSRCELPEAKLLAVRGPLTWERAGRPQGCLFGDPGLLARQLLQQAPKKRYKLGVVLHYADQQTAAFQELAAAHPSDVLLIDVRRSPADVIHAIDSCDGIVSSSLHGLIVADALQIPCAWKSAGEVLGHGFKFADHAQAVKSPRKPLDFRGPLSLVTVLSQLTPPPPQAVSAAAELHDLMRSLPQRLQAEPRLPRLPWLRYSVAKVQRLLRLKRAA
ncbi:polysaccharide pyruvyl transferase family protein [Anatilimnocola floriformis]|uniref:polysaccharide pyruvyl transferase family protein n=1 Tax=Anatilimnocola floriformis TaxID=2948575 RepID=UPI0020C4890A|nr:polysaccharide pyruvyl transferase family protein [Anatilimnocola floriformis]